MPLRPQRTRRTKVYDVNYNLGERYYKPVVDDLDRKYSGRPQNSEGGGGLGSLRAALDEAEAGLSARRSTRGASEEEPRRRPLSALMDDFDGALEGRKGRGGGSDAGGAGRSSARSALAAFEEDDDFSASASSRLRAARARAQEIEDEFTSSVATTARKARAGLDYSEKVLDTVGLKNIDISRARQALADDTFSKKLVMKKTTSSTEEAPVTKWTKLTDVDMSLGADDDFDAATAAARARKKAKARLAEIEAELGSDFVSGAAEGRARASRARLADLEAEMEAVADRSAARERRAAGLRALVAENAADSESSNVSSTRIRKVTSSVQSEKKTVTF